jgi:hypothetical protein
MMAPPAITAPKATAGCRAIVRAVIRGEGQGGEHGGGGQPPPPAPPGQEVGCRLDREGQEQQDDQHHEQAAQRDQQPEADVQGGRAGREAGSRAWSRAVG